MYCRIPISEVDPLRLKIHSCYPGFYCNFLSRIFETSVATLGTWTCAFDEKVANGVDNTSDRGDI